VLIHDGRIVSLSTSDSIPAARVPRGAQVLDCSGMSITAGLWNSHVHILPVKLLHADRKTAAQLTSALQEMLTG
jgi:predicted amidohydrolase YtcJ